MADGDAATAAGLAILTGIAKVREFFKHINATRDMIANHITSGTHSASAITTGTLDAARIPNLAGTKITSAVATATSATTATKAVGSDGPHAAEVSGTGPYYSVWVDGAHNFKRNTSSRRFKKNIKDLDVPLERLAALRPRLFDRKKGISNEPGLIAEEVHEILPEVVTLWWETDKDGNQIGERRIDGIRYDVLGALGVATLAREVQALRERVATLEGAK